jgi:hypothetical protein
LKLPGSSLPRVLFRTWLTHSSAFDMNISVGVLFDGIGFLRGALDRFTVVLELVASASCTATMDGFEFVGLDTPSASVDASKLLI